MFFGSIVAPKSTVSARDLCKAMLATDPRTNEIPTQAAAEQLSMAWKAEKNHFVEPRYLLDVWLELFRQTGYTDPEGVSTDGHSTI